MCSYYTLLAPALTSSTLFVKCLFVTCKVSIITVCFSNELSSTPYHRHPHKQPGSSGQTSLALLATILNAHRPRAMTRDSPVYRRVCLCREWAQGITSIQMHAHLHTRRSFNQAVIPSLKFKLPHTTILSRQ